MSGPHKVLGVQFRIIDLVAVVLAGVFLAGGLIPVLTTTTASHPSARCRARHRQLFQGLRMYLNNHDEFFPLAWHEGSGSDVSTVTSARFLLQEATDTNLNFGKATRDVEKAELLTNNAQFWADPVRGLTNDYFSPPAVFRLPAPDEMTRPYNRHTQYTELTAVVPSVEMPFLAGAAASLPQEEGRGETRDGIRGGFKRNAFVLSGKSYDAFHGVARSWSEWDEKTKTGSGNLRFDFRHGSSFLGIRYTSWVNVIFLDGHVDTVKRSHGDRLKKLHENWNIASVGAP